MSKKQMPAGFSTLDVLMSVVAIGLVATVIVVNLSAKRAEEKIGRAKTEMGNFKDLAVEAREKSGRKLLEITGSCHTCQDRKSESWNRALKRVQAVAQVSDQGITPLVQDPWGNPYCLDENEGESPAAGSPETGCSDLKGNLCLPDLIKSFGPDGLFDTNDDIKLEIPVLSKECQ